MNEVIIGDKYEIILNIGGGPFGSPVKKIVFGRDKSKIRFECFVIATDWKVNETVEAHKNGEGLTEKCYPESDEIKIGGGGHDIESVTKVESILSSFYIEEFDEGTKEIETMDGPTFELSINLAHYKIDISWEYECPPKMRIINKLVDLLREWADPIYAKSEWRQL